jgi:hypothetical protein
VIYRIAAIAALCIGLCAAQAVPNEGTQDHVPSAELQPDLTDPAVVRAQDDMQRLRGLIAQGAVPLVRYQRALEAIEDAKDLSILHKYLYSKDLLPEQADQLIHIAQRMLVRRQADMIRMRQLASSGVVSRAEAQATDADYDRAQTELQLAQSRAMLIQQIAESLRIERALASIELQVESHPEWAGSVYTRYDGRGVFTSVDREKIANAFAMRFSRTLPISADGETATHRSMHFDHRGRIDVALRPDQVEGQWLLRYLETNRIPYFAFRSAVPGMATGPHIHIGPGSTRLALAD